MAALETSVDEIVREFQKVPENRVTQLVDDFTLEGFKVEVKREPDGTYTVRARRSVERGGRAA